MAWAIQHPYPCSCHPTFMSRTMALDFVRTFQARGHVKRCRNVAIASPGDQWSVPKFHVKCQKESFVVRTNPNKRIQLMQFYGCPHACDFYEPEGALTPTRWMDRARHHIQRLMTRSVRWYTSFPIHARVILALICLGLVVFLLLDIVLPLLSVK